MDNITPTYSVEKIARMYSPQFIFFWGHKNEYWRLTQTCFSQWYERIFTLNGVTYRCAEQYMMAEKARLFGDDLALQLILKATLPAEMKKLGRLVKGYDDEVWNAHKFRIVVEGNYAKFTQNSDLMDFLLDTGYAVLVEASPYDRIWGIGMRAYEEGVDNPRLWKGQNLLGFALMQVRDMIEAERFGTVDS